MKEVDISVCIVSYNHEEYICKAIDSALSQNCKYSFEIIIGDDCSTDRTVDVIRKNYGNRVRLIARKKNLGISKNVWDICRKAKGKVIFSLAGDDWIVGNNTIEKCYEVLKDKPEISCVSGWSLIHDKRENIIDIVKNTNVEGYSLWNYLWGEQPRCAKICYRNTFLEKGNEYLYKCSRNNEEMAYWVYLLEKGNVHVLQECIYAYRYVRNEEDFNYNSVHDMVDIFCDNYLAIKRLQMKYKKGYDFDFILCQRIYDRFLSINLIPELENKKKCKKRMLKIISRKDYINYLMYLPVLVVFHGYFPMKFRRLVEWVKSYRVRIPLSQGSCHPPSKLV